MNDITFSCNGVIATGTSCDQSITVPYAEAGFFEYEDDYVCPDCLNQEEMHLLEWYDNEVDDSYALASAGHGTDEDYM